MEYTAEMRDGGIDMCVGLSAKVVKISDDDEEETDQLMEELL